MDELTHGEFDEQDKCRKSASASREQSATQRRTKQHLMSRRAVLAGAGASAACVASVKSEAAPSTETKDRSFPRRVLTTRYDVEVDLELDAIDSFARAARRFLHLEDGGNSVLRGGMDFDMRCSIQSLAMSADFLHTNALNQVLAKGLSWQTEPYPISGNDPRWLRAVIALRRDGFSWEEACEVVLRDKHQSHAAAEKLRAHEAAGIVAI